MHYDAFAAAAGHYDAFAAAAGHYDAFAAAAAPPPALASPAPEPNWTRRDDKFLELLYFTRNTVNLHTASRIIGKTSDQIHQRCTFLFAELRHVLESMEVLTPPAWDDTEVAAMAEAPAAEEEVVVPGAVVQHAAPPVAAVKGSAARAVGDGGGARKKKKKAEKWTVYEHRRFLAGLPLYRGNWNTMSREYLPSRTASQIASHYQKYRIREKQREQDNRKRASIHDITEPGIAVDIALPLGGEASAWEGELPRSEASAQGRENESWEPIESGEDGLSPVEEFPGEDDPGTLFT